jgi:hypothetical protein
MKYFTLFGIGVPRINGAHLPFLATPNAKNSKSPKILDRAVGAVSRLPRFPPRRQRAAWRRHGQKGKG